jgi:hypothetical protein
MAARVSDRSVARGPLPALTYSAHGLVNGDTTPIFAQPPAFSTPATPISPLSSYVITAAGLVDGNFVVTYVSGTLQIINPALRTVTPNSISPVACRPTPFSLWLPPAPAPQRSPQFL